MNTFTSITIELPIKQKYKNMLEQMVQIEREREKNPLPDILAVSGNVLNALKNSTLLKNSNLHTALKSFNEINNFHGFSVIHDPELEPGVYEFRYGKRVIGRGKI